MYIKRGAVLKKRYLRYSAHCNVKERYKLNSSLIVYKWIKKFIPVTATMNALTGEILWLTLRMFHFRLRVLRRNGSTFGE